jgi:hypothetical protein
VSLFAELRRRNVFKVGAAYAIVAWLLLQITDIVLPTFQAPLWVAQTITFVLAIGFPIAVILAWAFDVTPQGIKSASDVAVSDIPAQVGGQRLSYIIQSLILLAVGFLVMDQYVLDQGIRPGSSSTVATSGGTESSTSSIQRFEFDLGDASSVGATGLIAELAVAPDGSRIAYTANLGGAGIQLYSKDIDQFIELDNELL